MEQPVESNSFEKLKAIASLSILCPYFRFPKKSGKPGHGDLVLSTSTVVDIRTNSNYFNCC